MTGKKDLLATDNALISDIRRMIDKTQTLVASAVNVGLTKRLLVIDLKLGDFKPTGKKRETVELLALENSGIRVAEYMTELPPRKVLGRIFIERSNRLKEDFKTKLNSDQGKKTMNRHVNAISGRLSVRPPQRLSLEILDRITEIAPPGKEADVAAHLWASQSEFPSLCFALANGVGKMRLMGAFISYLYLARGVGNFFFWRPT